MYDGDQTTMKIIWSLEANKECEEVIQRKSFILNTTGGLIRQIGNEALQTFYTMTKDYSPKKGKILNAVQKQEILSIPKEEFTFDKLVDLFGVLTDEGVDKLKSTTSKYHCQDKFTLRKGEYEGIKEDTETTVGRYIFNKILFSETPLSPIVGYVNHLLLAGDFKKIEAAIAKGLLFDKITVQDVKNYIDVRDWLGFQFHGVITSSFTPETIQTPKEVAELRKQLYKKYEKELADGDTKVMEMIEKQLVAKTLEVLKDDDGMDLYVSGARGSVGNNMKNMMMVRGSVMNPSTGQYDLVLSSLNDGIAIKDIPAASNVIVGGAYPKSVNSVELRNTVRYWKNLSNCWKLSRVRNSRDNQQRSV